MFGNEVGLDPLFQKNCLGIFEIMWKNLVVFSYKYWINPWDLI
jgi:hypothetical protein